MNWKIYHKKNFCGGLCLLVLGVALPVTCLIRGWERFSVKDGVLTVLLILTGVGVILRSLDREKSREDRREERDERNRWIELRSQAVCYRVLWWLVVAGLLACGVGYSVTKEDVYLGLFSACLVLYLAALVSRLVSKLYFENRM